MTSQRSGCRESQPFAVSCLDDLQHDTCHLQCAIHAIGRCLELGNAPLDDRNISSATHLFALLIGWGLQRATFERTFASTFLDRILPP